MNKKSIFLTLGILTLVVSAIMYSVGTNNSRLTELLDFFWIPIPLGLILIALAFQKKKKPPTATPPTPPPANDQMGGNQEN